MSDFGITSAGFLTKRYEDLKAAFDVFYQGQYGNPNLNPDSVIGRREVGQSNLLTALWELFQIVYNAPFIALTDEGSIDNVLANEGMLRIAALPTILKVVCTFTDTATIPAGSLISNSAGLQFSAMSSISKTGAGTATGNFQCTLTGPEYVPSDDTLTVVSTVSNWTSAALSSDADAVTLGRDIETLAEARVRYVQSLGMPGAGTIPALEANLNNIPGVKARVLENVTDTVDANGFPPHSITIIVDATESIALNAQIANMIWTKRGGGVQTYAADIGASPHTGRAITVQDTNGDNQTVNFSYVTPQTVNITDIAYELVSEETAPADIHTAILAVLTSIFLAFKPGQDVLCGRVIGQLYQIPGINTIAMKINGDYLDLSVDNMHVAKLGSVTFL